jgi:hypothetical protein
MIHSRRVGRRGSGIAASSRRPTIIPIEEIAMTINHVTARFYVSEVVHRAYNPSHANVTLVAAGRGEQNKAWAEATPSGTITMSINNPAAAEFFVTRLGKDIALSFNDIGDDSFSSPHDQRTVAENAKLSAEQQVKQDADMARARMAVKNITN